jgi:hypothetical protein
VKTKPEESKNETLEANSPTTTPIREFLLGVLEGETEHCLYEGIVGEYNAILPELPRAEKLTPFRAETLQRRIDEDPVRQELGWWKEYFRRVREFPWPMGDNPKGWRADFDWLTEDRGMQKIIEGAFRKPQISYSGGRTRAGEELQKKYTNERGEIDAFALLRDIES